MIVVFYMRRRTPRSTRSDTLIPDKALFRSITEAVETYPAATPDDPPPRRAAFAVASPITGDRIKLTNRDWSFSIRDLRRDLRLERFEVINDFTAVALSLPRLGEDGLRRVGGGEPVADTPLAVLGPGRSEEHTSELQSLMRISYAVFCLKKKNMSMY